MKCDFQVVGNFQLFFLRLIILVSLGILWRTNFDRFHNGLTFILKEQSYLLSRSAHQTLNFTNPEFQFSQFTVLQSGFFLFNITCCIGIYWSILIIWKKLGVR